MRRTFLAVIVCILLPLSTHAQSKESLLIGRGDLIHVRVFDTPELEQRTRVTDAGTLDLVLGGSVKIEGLTPTEAARAVNEALSRAHILLRPQVEITIDEYATQKVSIFGEVRSPGAYSLPTPRSVIDVLSLGGGLTDLANRHIVIIRNNGSKKEPYFVSNDSSALPDMNVTVNPGDTVFVPKAAIVYILGDVKLPGGYAMTNNESQLSVLELVARAGGTPPTAVPSHASLIRKSDTGYIVDHLPLSAMQKGKQSDLPLAPNDIVYVPFSYLRNLAVNASGVAASAATAAVYRF
jgi:polysaccharide export outer membrane protein